MKAHDLKPGDQIRCHPHAQEIHHVFDAYPAGHGRTAIKLIDRHERTSTWVVASDDEIDLAR